MATRRLSVKFDTEGFNQAVSQLQQTGRAFDSALQRARQASREAVAAQRAARSSGDVSGEVAAQRRIEQSATAANRAIAASYRELGVRSSESINQLRARAVAAFEAIKASGTASARDIAAAQDALNNRLQDLDSQLGDTGKTARDGGGGFDFLTAAIGAATLALGGFIRASYQTGRATDTSLRALSTLTDDSKGLHKELQQLSKELGYQVTATELATTGYDVLSAGFNKTADVVEILKNSQKAAVGGFAEIGVVADAATTILNAYGKGVGETEKVTSQFIQTQNDGKIIVSQYAQQIGSVASTAAASNVSLEELNATVSVATASGVRVESAFTGLRQAISSIVKPSAEAEKVAEKLGIKFDAATLKQKGFAAVLEDVRKKAGGNAQALGILFGSVEAVAAVQPALNDFEKFTEFIERQKNAAGEADKAFQKMNGSIASSEKSLSGVANAIKNKAWESFGLIIKPISAAIAGMGNAFLALPAPIQSTIIVLTSLTVTVVGTVAAFKILNAALATVGITNKLRSLVELELVLRNLRATGISFKAFQISQFVTNIGASFNLAAGFIGFYTKALIEAINIQRIAAVQFVTSGGLLTALGSAFTFLISPIGLIIVGLAALTAAFVVLYTKSELFRKGVNFLGELLKTVFLDAVNAVNGAFNALGRAINAVGKSIDWFATGTGKNFDELLKTIGNFSNSTLEYLGSLADWLANLDMFKPLIDSAKNAAAGIKGAFGEGDNPVKNFLTDGPLGIFGIKPITAARDYLGGLFGRTQERIDKEAAAEKEKAKVKLSPAPVRPKLTGGAGVDIKGDSGGSSGSRGSNKEKEYVDFELVRPKGVQTSGYGWRKGRMHNGVDFSQGRARNKYPIEALLPGTVSQVGNDKGGWGNYVVVKSVDKLGRLIEVLQAHLDSVVVTVGQEVRQGQLLGREGSTGRSTGTHNHLEVKVGGKKVNPSSVIGKKFSLSSNLGSPSEVLERRDSEAQQAREKAEEAAKKAAEQAEEAAKKAAEQVKDDAKLARDRAYEKKKARVTFDGERQRSGIENAFAEAKNDLDKRLATTKDEQSRTLLERRIASLDSDKTSLLQNSVLASERAIVEFRINQLMRVRATLTQEESDELNSLEDRRKAIHTERFDQLAEEARAFELRQAENAAADKEADKQYLNQIRRLEQELEINNLQGQQAEFRRQFYDAENSYYDRKQEIELQIAEAKARADEKALSNLRELSAQNERRLGVEQQQVRDAELAANRELNLRIDQLAHEQELSRLKGDQAERQKQIWELEQAHRERSLELETLIQQARESGDYAAIERLRVITELNDFRLQRELKQVTDQGKIAVQYYETVGEAARAATQQFFEDIFTGTKNLGDALNSFLTSILKAVAQLAATNVTKAIFSSFGGGGYATGGYVSGPGTGTSDSISARLSNGEFVMRAKAVKHWGTNFLDSLNTMQAPALSLATVDVGSSAGGSSRSQTIVMNVSTPDANSFRKSGSQLGREAAEQLRRGMNRNG
jgi:TP901 family phage tail tape measure protein